jgi:uncharacterized protein with von Willebrand factor type A (vWA) domain
VPQDPADYVGVLDERDHAHGAVAARAFERPERHNAVKVLMLMDIGGTMDDHVKLAQELLSASKTEFKHLEFYYFRTCLYDYGYG